jgi:hypothetical protein
MSRSPLARLSNGKPVWVHGFVNSMRILHNEPGGPPPPSLTRGRLRCGCHGLFRDPGENTLSLPDRVRHSCKYAYQNRDYSWGKRTESFEKDAKEARRAFILEATKKGTAPAFEENSLADIFT